MLWCDIGVVYLGSGKRESYIIIDLWGEWGSVNQRKKTWAGAELNAIGVIYVGKSKGGHWGGGRVLNLLLASLYLFVAFEHLKLIMKLRG